MSVLTTIIEKLNTATGLAVKPLYTTDLSEQIVYTWYTQADNGAVANNRLELRLITKTVENAEEYKQEIISTLVNVADNMEIDGIYNCDVNGGGSLYDGNTQTFHTLIYFDLITRSAK